MPSELADDDFDCTAKSESEESGDGSERLIERRDYLKLGLATATAATAASGTFSSPAEAATTRHGIQFEQVVDAVDDLGLDPTGGKSITPVLESELTDGTLVEFPPGTYFIGNPVTLRDLNQRGIYGTGDQPSDVVFQGPRDESAPTLFRTRYGNGFLLENVAFNQYDSFTTGGIRNSIVIDDGLEIHDIEFIGKESPYGQPRLQIVIANPDGKGVIDNLVTKEPVNLVESLSNQITLLANNNCKGTVHIKNSHFENCGQHGCYTSHVEGPVIIENCYFKNNQNTHARLAGGNSKCIDSTFVWDQDNHPNNGTYDGQTGLVWEGGNYGFTGGLVENCDFVVNSSAPNSGCLKVDGSHGGIDVRNCRFTIDDDVPPLIAEAPGDSHMIDGLPPKPWDITVDQTSLTGNGNKGYRADGSIEIVERGKSVVSASCIQTTGDRDGIGIKNSDGCAVDTCNINVKGEATVFTNSTVETSNITYSGTCPVAVDDTDTSASDDSTTDGSTSDGSTSDGSTTEMKTLEIVGDSDSSVNYEFTVSGDLQPGAGLEDDDVIDGSTATGRTAGYPDAYEFSGEVTAFSADGPVIVTIDGQQVDPSQLGSTTDGSTSDGSTSDGSTTEMKTLEIVGDSDSSINYEFTVSGDLQPGAGLEDDDVIDGSTVTGRTAGYPDAYGFSGEVTAFSADGPVIVTIDGQQVDPSQLGSTTDVLSIVGDSSGTTSQYSVTVTGSIEPNPDKGTIGSEDTINGGNAEGTVADDVDSYLFTGVIAAFDISGPADVYLNDTKIDPADLGLDHQIEIVGSGISTATYSLTVNGDLIANPESNSIESDDSVSGSSAQGTVTDDSDAYLFSGDISEFSLDGLAGVYVDGKQVDPDLLGSGTTPTLPNQFLVDASQVDGSTSYKFEVTGDIEKSPDLGSVESDDTISDGLVSGSVTADKDGYRFSGNIVRMSVEGSASVNFEDVDG